MDLDRDGRDWPNKGTSRFVEAAGLRWHVQVLGKGPPLLLIHGTGASTHSWRHLIPLVSPLFTVYAPDLPGHAFTQAPANSKGYTLPAMASGIAALMDALGVKPVLIAAHSAGAAIAVRACVDRLVHPCAIVAINGALVPFGGMAGEFFSPLAKILVTQSWVPRLMTWRAGRRGAVEKLLRDIGSDLAAEDVEFYARLFQNEGHVAATLSMMAYWDLAPLARDLSLLRTPLVLVAGENDKAIAPADAERVAQSVPHAQVVRLSGVGHLAHEENPKAIADICRRWACGSSRPVA